MDDGNEVIAKVPCPNAGAPSLMTASEVATLRFCTFHVLAVLHVLDHTYILDFLSKILYLHPCSGSVRLEFGSSKPSRLGIHHHGEAPGGCTRRKMGDNECAGTLQNN